MFNVNGVIDCALTFAKAQKNNKNKIPFFML